MDIGKLLWQARLVTPQREPRVLPAPRAPRRRGNLPPVGSLLRVEPAGSVQLAALKAAGNPLAAGSAVPVDPGAVALRLVEATGRGTRVDVGSEVATLGGLRSEFRDIVREGTLEQTNALPEEANEPHLAQMPRLKFRSPSS